MTAQEILEILSVIRVTYPDRIQKTQEDIQAEVKAWLRWFKDEPYEVVITALDSFILSDTKGFAPKPGQIKDIIFKMKNPVQIDADEAWNMVSKALRNGIYGSEEEFAKLPPEVQVGVGSPSQLREWAMMDSDTVQSVIGSNFKKGYRGRVEAKKEYDKLPCETKNMIERLTNGMKMIE